MTDQDVDTGIPPRKRSRISRACDQCRTARERCDGIQPRCSACTTNARACTYTTNPKKRGIQSGYIRTLEVMLGALFEKKPEIEDSLCAMLASSGLTTVLGSGLDSAGGSMLHHRWRDSRPCKLIEQILSGEAIPPTTKDEEVCATSSMPALLSCQTPSTAEVKSNEPDSIAVSESKLPSISPPDPSSSQPAFNQASVLRLPSNHWQLVEIYFSYTHCWLPISEKHDILRACYSYQGEGLELTPMHEGSGLHAELWAILAIATVQAHVNGNTNQPSASSGHSGAEVSKLCEISRSLIPSEHRKTDLGHVRALLLLTLINLGMQNLHTSWVLLGLASRTAVLHADASEAVRNPQVRSIIFGCFVLDTIVSVQLGKDPYLKTSHIDHFPALGEDHIAEWHPWSGYTGFDSGIDTATSTQKSPGNSISIFNRLIQIVAILNNYITHRDASVMAAAISEWIKRLPDNLEYVRSGAYAQLLTPQQTVLRLVLICMRTFCSPTIRDASEISSTLHDYSSKFGLATVPVIFPSLILLAYGHLNREECASIRSLVQACTSNWNLAVPGEAWWNSTQSGVALKRHETPLQTNQQHPTSTALFHSSAPGNQDISHAAQGSSVATLPVAPPHDLSYAVPVNDAVRPFYPRDSYYHNFSAPIPPVTEPVSGNESSLTEFIDHNTFLNDLASLDSVKSMQRRPQFMQNLGFAPAMSSMIEATGSEFGQYDPLLGPYFQGDGSDQNIQGSSADHGRIYHGT